MLYSIKVNTGSCNGLLPDDTKPLQEPMLINYQYSLMAFTYSPEDNLTGNVQDI